MTVVVMNLANPEEKQFYTCTPKEAVIAAYAQSKMDWSTWQYADRYEKMVVETNLTVTCGDFSAFKDGREL